MNNIFMKSVDEKREFQAKVFEDLKISSPPLPPSVQKKLKALNEQNSTEATNVEDYFSEQSESEAVQSLFILTILKRLIFI